MTADEHGASADRQALLELLLAEEGIDLRPSSIGPRAPDEDLVLSHAQERMWFLDQFETDTSSFNVRIAVRLRGPLDVSVLRRALDDIVQRHDILRTIILCDGGKPRPSVLESAAMPMSIVDVDGDEERVEAVLAEEASRRFALDRELPIHVCVVRIADDDHVLSVVIHHIASDGWSLRVFFNELGRLYVAHLRGEPSPLSELPVQYLDYATWQRRDGGDGDRHQLDYWREQLAGPLPIFEIPPDFSRPARHTFEGAQVEELLPQDLTRALRDLGTGANATMFMTLLAAFSVVTSRHAGETDVLIGTPVAGRRRPELEPMMGMFLNTLALRNQLGDNPTFRELLARVRDTSLSAFDNQEVPFERLLAELHPVRDLSRTPLFQIFFNVLNLDIEQASFELPDVQVEVIENHDLGSKFDLTVYVAERENGTTLLFVYNRALYTAQTMEHLAGQFVHVLRQVVADPDRPIFDYSLVTRPAEPNIPDAGAPLDATWYGSVPDSVRRVARDQPSRPAVADGAHCWTYGMLANQMARLGNWLRLAHVGKGDVVAIYAHRSASLVWAVVGALASGAAYVLLDPRYPPNRLAQYLRIAKPKAWLALDAAGEVPEEVLRALDDVGVATRLSLPDLAHIDCLDSILGGACNANQASLPEIGPDDPASLTFTSGSTGVPKAVIGRHGSLTHFFPWMSHEFQVTSDDRFSMLSGLAHDPIQRDMFWPLSVGATLFVPDPEQLATSGWLAEWMRDNAINVAHLTPAMGKLVIEAGPSSPGSPPRSNATIPSLRLALFMGDVLTRGDVAQLRAVAPDVKALNLYGSTETQRASAYHVADLETTDDGNHRYREILPLGTGMPDVQLLLRTPTGATAGVGEIADIYFRSPHLALGYFGDDQLTSDRFTRNPVSDDPADRLYRTGDRGRYRPDGSVEFCGRADQQIKVRGFRIELGEIQATLARHQNVRDAVVVPADADSPDGGLVAYVVLEGRPQPDTIELARFLRAELPAHMVPADIVAIDRIPLTPNGKLDRAALIDPRPHRRPWTAGGAPRDSVERMLVELWEDVLNRDPVMIDDDFFALGGYSLLATRLFALIEERTGKRLPVSILFENPTVAGLADVIRDDGWKPEWSSMVPIQPEGNKPPLFYVAPYVISVLQLAQLGEALGRDQPLYGFQPQGLDGRLPAHERIEDMAKHYIAELKSVQPSGPYSIGGHCSGAWVAFEMACQLEASGDAVHAVVMVDQGPPGVQRPHVRPLPYLINRVRFYFRDGRLRHSAAWQFKILTARFLLRRVGPPTARYEEHTREVNRRAFRNYRGGRIKHDITLVRSAESLALDDKTWFVRWSERTEGEVTVVDVGGTHANLLVRPFVVDLAAKIERAISDECPHTATVAQPQPITNPERAR